MTHDPRHIALSYIEACGAKNYSAVAPLLAPNITFVCPGNSLTGAEPYLAVLRQLGPVWLRSDVKKVFADGPDVCVIYDFVTDSPAGSVPIVEWLRIEGGLITSIDLFFDRVSFKPASEELARRAAA